jgi:crotonobetainyl-CoA:carnitine CoA-transferase CaiB-like acyl-CoA transferase
LKERTNKRTGEWKVRSHVLATPSGHTQARDRPTHRTLCGCGDAPLNATHAILAALLHRDRTGEGQSVEIPMFETMAQFVLGDHMAGRSFEPPIGPPGYARLLSPDRRPYRTLDGYVCALVYTDKQWTAFFRAIGQENDGQRDPRLSSMTSRTSNYDYVYGWFSDVMKTRTTSEWMRLFDEADIPHAPLHDLDSLIDDPHLAAVGLLQSIEHPTEGTLRVARPETAGRTPDASRQGAATAQNAGPESVPRRFPDSRTLRLRRQ